MSKAREWLAHPLLKNPLVRRVTGYSAGSVVAIVVSEAFFAATLGWLHRGTTIASAAGFVGGAIPNYILNRRWAWRDRRGRTRQSEVTLYMVTSLATFVVSAIVTHEVEKFARHLTADRGGQVALVTLAFFGVSAVFFVVKFFIYETVVFRHHTHAPAPDDEISHLPALETVGVAAGPAASAPASVSVSAGTAANGATTEGDASGLSVH